MSEMTKIGNPIEADRDRWLAVSSVGLATFSVVTTEMMPVGLLNPISESLETSVGTTGLAISLPAFLAAFFAPIVVLASGGIDRKKILAVLAGLLIAANIASAAAVDIVWLLAARCIVGFCMGGVWAIAGGLAVRLVSSKSIGLATSIIFGGVAAASVFGVPLGAQIGDVFGWRVAFFSMAGFSGLVLALLLASVPALPVRQSVKAKEYASLSRNWTVLAGLLITFLIVSGHFMGFTFIRPLLQDIAGYRDTSVGPLLFAYGVAGIVGNFIIGSLAAKSIRKAVIIIVAGLATAIGLFPELAPSSSGSIPITILWGLAYGGVSVTMMNWMMKAAPDAVEVATSLYVAVFNIGIAAGAFVGGQLVDSSGLLPTIGTAFVIVVFAIIPLLTVRRH